MAFLGKSVIVVGGYGGLGFETCNLLLNRGIKNLGIFDNQVNEDKLNLLQAKNENKTVKFWQIDVTNREETDKAFEQAALDYDGIDFVIHSVGIVDELYPARAIEVNLLGTINVNLSAIKCMKTTEGGTILTVASVLGLEPSPSYPIYAASKHGIIGFLRSLGTEELYEHTGIQIKIVCPGFTRPSMAKSNPEVIFPYLSRGSALDRFQPVQNCAQCVIDALETEGTGSIWIIDNSQLTEVAPITYFFPPPLA